jgi:hypothetical protein
MSNQIHNAKADCPHCNEIRAAAEMIAMVSLSQWQMCDIAQLAAYFYARVRKAVITDDSTKEQEFIDWFNNLCHIELERLNLMQPIEPQSFDKEFDFRQHIKGE